MPQDRGMTLNRAFPQWLTTRETAEILRVDEGTLRNWRSADMREGPGTVDRPGRGGLVYRRFSGAVRYWAPSVLGPAQLTPSDAAEVSHAGLA